MEVYLVKKCFDYEGSETVAVYTTEQEAKKHVEWLRKRIDNNKEYADGAKIVIEEVLQTFNSKDWT